MLINTLKRSKDIDEMARYKRMLVSTKLFNIAVNDSGAKKCTVYLLTML